jgi:plastocyanin
MRITANSETAEELTIDVFHDIWRRASRYDAANGTVLGWIMNQARSRAIDRLRFESRKKRSDSGEVYPQAEVSADPHDVLVLRNRDDVPQVFGPTLMMPGQSFSLPFEVASSYTFACTAHLSGQMTIIVEPRPDTPWARIRWRARELVQTASQ